MTQGPDGMTWRADRVGNKELPNVGDLIELGPDAGFRSDSQPFTFKVESVATNGPEWVSIAGKMTDDGPRQTYRVRVAGIRFVERAG